MIEIMPINEFAGDISWGYNPAYPYAVEEAYGGPDDLKQLIDEAHKLGLAAQARTSLACLSRHS